MQAIRTKFLGPNNRGQRSRYKATCDAGSITVNAEHSVSPQTNHANAARALAIKLGWTKRYYGALRGGSLPDGSYAFVFDFNDKDDSNLYCFAPDPAPHSH